MELGMYGPQVHHQCLSLALEIGSEVVLLQIEEFRESFSSPSSGMVVAQWVFM